MTPDLRRLAAPFLPSDIEWKPGAVTRDKSKGLAMAYISSRAVQDRLDEVCGPAGWRNEFKPGPDGGVLCGISVRVTHDDGTSEWVTKWDGADNTDVEAVKGGLSGAMKRAAVQWGIGRYLYSLDAQWVRLDERGRFAEPPRVPREFQPAPAERAPGGPARDPRSQGPSRPISEAPPEPRAAQASAGGPEEPSRCPEGSARPAGSPGPRAQGSAGQRRIVRPAAPPSGDGGTRPPRPPAP